MEVSVRTIQFEKNTLDEKIKEIPLFKYLSYKEREKIIEIFEIVEYDIGEKIITEKTIDHYFYILLKGSVDVYVGDLDKKDPDEEDSFIRLNTIEEKSIFGEAAIFSNFKRTASIVAKELVHVIRIERKMIIQYIKKFPQAGINILMLIIYYLLNKLRIANQDLAWERKAMIEPGDIDDFIKNFLY